MLAARARFLSAVLGFSVLCLVLVPSAFAQRQPGGPGGPGGGFGGGKLALLRSPNVVGELELTDDQTAEIKAISDKVGEELRGLFQGGGGGGGTQEERDARREKLQKVTADAEKQVDKLLLPNQVKRLKQIEFRQSNPLTRGGTIPDATAEALGISDDDKEKVAAALKEADQDLRKKLAKIRAEHEQKLLEALTPAVRAKWKVEAGDYVDVGGGGFGGFGGAGGGAFGGGTGGRPGAGGNRPPARPQP